MNILPHYGNTNSDPHQSWSIINENPNLVNLDDGHEQFSTVKVGEKTIEIFQDQD